MLLAMEHNRDIYQLFAEGEVTIGDYYSTIMSFYHIRSREGTKYKAVIHCSVLV